MDKQLSRGELFLLVWERPTQDIANEIGISDIALTKWCKKLQVPIPSPGYWAKIKAGKRPKKPLLKELSEQLIERQEPHAKKHRVRTGSLGLSPVQAEIFQRAADELAGAGIEFGELRITRSGVQSLNTELAAQFLILIQHRHERWLKDRAGGNEVALASIRTIQALTSKLLPLAKTHTLILEKECEKRLTDDRGPKIIIRLTHEFQQQVANLYQLVRENNLSYVVWELRPFEHAWIVQYHYHYEDYSRAHSAGWARNMR